MEAVVSASPRDAAITPPSAITGDRVSQRVE